jgi:hypothetical protein
VSRKPTGKFARRLVDSDEAFLPTTGGESVAAPACNFAILLDETRK